MDAVGRTDREINIQAPVFIPIGSFECHSHMLPLGTDTFIAKAFCQEFAKISGGAVLPQVNYSCCPHTADLPGTIHVDHDDLKRYLTGICVSLQKQGFGKTVLVPIFRTLSRGKISV